jgi:uncharacterized membrane protein YfcA
VTDGIAIGLIFTLAGLVKGVVGLGLPTIAMGLLGLWLTPLQAASLLLVPSIVTNIVQMAGPGLAGLLRQLGPMLASVVLGTCAGWWAWGGLGGRLAGLGLGVMVMAYGLLGITALRLSLSPQASARLAIPTGLITGVITAGTGIFVIPLVPWLQASGLPRERLVQALGVSLLVSALSLTLVLGGAGHLGLAEFWGSSLALLPALLGQALGSALRRRLNEALFRRCFFAGLVLLGLHLVWRAWP